VEGRVFRAVAGDEGGTGVAALQDRRGGVEPQPRALLVRAVAGGTVLRQDRLDVAEIIDRLGGREWPRPQQENDRHANESSHAGLAKAVAHGSAERGGGGSAATIYDT